MKNQVAIVTGASRGIGHAIARALAEQGVQVVCVSTKQEGADQVAAELEATYKTRCLGVGADVSNYDQVQGLIQKTMEMFGDIHILVNNAGIARDNLLLRMQPAEWDTVMDVNLKSVFNTTKAVTRPMLKKRYGRIINITSVVGVMGNAGQANYAASKAGVIGFTKSVARELGAKGITCNAIAPGFIDTDMIQTLPKEYIDNIIESVPIKRLGKPDDVANMVVFLASDLAPYTTGQVIHVDGGMQM